MCADDGQVPSIEDSVLLNPSFPTVSERYFTHYYYVPKKQAAKAVDASKVALSSQEFEEPQHQGVSQSDPKIPLEENAKMDDCSTISKNSIERRMDSSDDLPCKKRLKLADDCKKSTAASDSQLLEDDGQKCPINNDLVQMMHSGAVISTANGNNSAANATPVDAPECAELGSAAKDVLDLSAKVDPDDKEYYLTGKETLVMVHSNKLCVVSLSPYHPIVRDNKTVIKVDYEVFGIDRLSNKVSGKGKRGAQVMGSKATLCRMHTSDGTAYDVTCGARGKLVQVNKKLLEKPDMARSHVGADGWLGVVLPSLQHYDALMAAMMPANRYKEAYQKQFGEQGP